MQRTQRSAPAVTATNWNSATFRLKYFFCLLHSISLPSLHSLRQLFSCCRQTNAKEVELAFSLHRERCHMTSLSLTIMDYVIDDDVIANVINGTILCVLPCACVCVWYSNRGVFNRPWCVWGSVLLTQHTASDVSIKGWGLTRNTGLMMKPSLWASLKHPWTSYLAFVVRVHTG